MSLCLNWLKFVAQVSQVCVSCGVNMGEYFCDVCKFYDDDVSSNFVIFCYAFCIDHSYQPMHFSSLMVQTEKGQYHCHDCGICRWASIKENFTNNIIKKSSDPVSTQFNQGRWQGKFLPLCKVWYALLEPLFSFLSDFSSIFSQYHANLSALFECPA